MKAFIVLIVSLASVYINAFGNTYRGTITQTVTGTNDPLYYIGEVFVGYYQYQSPSIDGTFCTDNFSPPLTPKPPGAIASLDGSLYMPFATCADVRSGNGGVTKLTWGPGGRFNGIDQTMNEGTLVVSNGEVSGFFWSWENGGFYTCVSNSSFTALSFYDQWAAEGTCLPFTCGTVEFGSPNAVPDSGGTVTLLGCVMLAVFALRRQLSGQIFSVTIRVNDARRTVSR